VDHSRCGGDEDVDFGDNDIDSSDDDDDAESETVETRFKLDHQWRNNTFVKPMQLLSQLSGYPNLI
jgi:hypothetical protein